MTIQSPAKGRHPSAASATLGIITLDESGRVLAWNDAAEGIFGWKASEVIGKAPPYIPAGETKGFHEMLRATLQSGPQTGLGLRRQHKSGARVEINVWMAPMPQTSQQTSHVMELIEDVTAANQQERELAQNSHFKSAILNALPEHVAVIDPTGLITATNHSWNDFALGNGVDDPALVGVGRNYLEVCRSVHGGEDYPYAHASLTGIQAVLNGHLHIFELEYPCHSLTEKRWFLMRVTPLEDGSGAVITHENITRRYNAETARLMAEKRLSTILNIAADCIVAINNDPNAPIFDFAHFGIVGDATAILPALTEAFRARLRGAEKTP
ncbi:MAG TPA: PAS domain S-box protein [Anaerolinea sp.]|nr:PAS domain S-box protein [Anaerolinea sp.]